MRVGVGEALECPAQQALALRFGHIWERGKSVEMPKDCVSKRNPAGNRRAYRRLSCSLDTGACAAMDTEVGRSAKDRVSRQNPAVN